MQQLTLWLIKKHLPVPECRVHLPPAKYTFVNRGLRGRVRRNIDAFSLARDDHRVDRGFSVSRNLRMPHTVELDGEIADGKRLGRGLPAARDINQCVFVPRGKFFGRFPVKVVGMQVRKKQAANRCVRALPRDDLPPGPSRARGKMGRAPASARQGAVSDRRIQMQDRSCR